MKQITITIPEADYRRGLAEILMAEGAVPVVFEVPDDYDVNSYEGLTEYRSAATAAPAPAFASSFPEVVAWLNAYTGDFEFYLSLKSQLAAKGTLSEKQIACVQRAIDRDKAAGKATPTAAPQTFSIAPGTVLVLTKWAANKVAAAAGFKRAHRVVDVIAVEAETPKAFRVRVKLSARRTSFCGCCGLPLENPQSVAAGIGPICAEKAGISFGVNSLAELEALISTAAEATLWVPKRCIKEQINSDGSVIKAGEPEEAESALTATEEADEVSRIEATREDASAATGDTDKLLALYKPHHDAYTNRRYGR